MNIRESMTKVKVGSFRVRVWRAEKWNAPEGMDPDLVADIQRAGAVLGASPLRIAQSILKLKRVNAVEVLCGSTGHVLYKDWP